MTKRYFSKRSRPGNPLLRPALALLLLLACAALGIFYFKGRATLPAWTAPAASESAQVLEDGKKLTAEGKWEEAGALIEAALQRMDAADPLRFDLLALAAETDFQRGRTAESIARYQELQQLFPGHPAQPAMALQLAHVLLASGQREEGLARLNTLRETAPPDTRAGVLLELARDAVSQNKRIEARDMLRAALKDAPEGSATWNGAIDLFGEANVALVFSAEETPESKFYAVEKGDSLTRIGIKLNTTQGLLLRANGLTEESTLNVGQRLKYTPKDFKIIIERSTCLLYLVDNDGLFKRYHTGLGMPGYETTLGAYHIGNKEKDPTWFKPGSGPVPPNDPANELGTRWMPLIPMEAGLPTDLGIHGTIAPETIGQYMSHGCPRLRREDVEELYDLVVRSTPVEIAGALTEDHKRLIRGLPQPAPAAE
ncbi:MAG: L,D-transpeptidase family protein [Candidatus Hydrogenedentes bacterium]|nr:L,D-transpeptidase family protein [Candidatus Hydrogenedentota bacterium]